MILTTNMMTRFKAENYTGNAARLLPLHCRACNKEIKENDQIHKVHSACKTRYFCKTCWNKPVLVYSLQYKPSSMAICLKNGHCSSTGKAATDKFNRCASTKTCIYKFKTSLEYIKYTKMTRVELSHMKMKYAKNGVNLG